MGDDIDYRRHVAATIYDLISNGSSNFAQTPQETREQLARILEKSCYDEALTKCGMRESFSDSSQFRVCYHYYATTIMYHCDAANGLAMLNRIYDKTISWKNVPSLNYRDLDPAPSAPEYNAYIESRNEITVAKTASTMYTCKRCGGPMEVKQVQMRSLDEAVSLKLTCTACLISV